MEEMKSVDVNQNAVQTVNQPVLSAPASPYVATNSQNCFAEQVPPTVKRFRENFAIFGTSALLFGICFTACFFRAGIGISYPVFILAAIALIQFVGINLRNVRESAETIAVPDSGENKRRGKREGSVAIPYYVAAFLIAVSVVFTTKGSMHFFSTVAICLLLEVAFLELLFSDTEKGRNFEERCKEVLLLPFTAIANCMTGLIDGFGFLRKMKFFRNEKVRHVLLGVLIAIPLLIVVVALLTSADMIFSSWTETALDYVFFSSNPYLVCLLTVVIYVAAYGIMAAASRMMALKQTVADVQKNADTLSGQKGENTLTALTVTVLLTLVYLLFCGIQLFFLFGNGKVSLPEGFTYAEYARQGFFQLLAVTFLNVLILMLCRKPASKNLVLRVVLTVFSACTYIMIASAAMRMLLYIDAYHLTFLRILVLWFLGLNTLLVTGIILAIYRSKFPLFRYFVAATAVCYIVLAYANVDHMVASFNLKTGESVKVTDMDYLAMLSADAAPVMVPALAEIIEMEKNGTTVEHSVFPGFGNLSDDQKYSVKRSLINYVIGIAEAKVNDFRSWNYAQHKALKVMEDYELAKKDRVQIYFTNYSDTAVFSVEYSNKYESQGMMNADNTPLAYGDTVTLVDDVRTLFNEDGKVYVYDRGYNPICSVSITPEELTSGSVHVELYSDPYGELYCMVSH